MSDRARRRKRLFDEDPHCRVCGVETVLALDVKVIPKNAAVLLSVVRDGLPATDLACRECVDKENRKRMAEVGIEELRLRSSPQGKCVCPNCGNEHFKSIKSL